MEKTQGPCASLHYADYERFQVGGVLLHFLSQSRTATIFFCSSDPQFHGVRRACITRACITKKRVRHMASPMQICAYCCAVLSCCCALLLAVWYAEMQQPIGLPEPGYELHSVGMPASTCSIPAHNLSTIFTTGAVKVLPYARKSRGKRVGYLSNFAQKTLPFLWHHPLAFPKGAKLSAQSLVSSCVSLSVAVAVAMSLSPSPSMCMYACVDV